MTPDSFLDAHGQPVYAQGYCAVWNTVSHPAPQLGNRRSLFLPNAFSDVLKRPMLSLTCQPHHTAVNIGSIRDRSLEVWEDDYGLGFRCGPLPVTSGAVIQSIVAGRTRGASTRAVVAEQEIREIDGAEVVVIRRMRKLLHIAPVDVPMDDATAVWCSHESPYDLPPRIKALAENWGASRVRHETGRKLKTMARMVSALPRRAPASRAATSRTRRAPVPAAIYSPAPAGLSQEAWEEFGFAEAAGRRAHKQAQARKQARQRARSAA